MKKNLFLFSLVFLVALLAYPLVNGQTHLSEASIIFTKGTVFINGNRAKKGDRIKLKDVLETRANSLCMFKVGGKNIFKIKSNAKLIYNISGNRNSNIELRKGFMAGVIKYKKILAKDELKINAPTLIAGVRGTSFAMKVESDSQVYFCTCNGTIHFQDKFGKQDHEISNAQHGAERFTLDENGSIKIKKYGLEFHNDDTLEELAIEIDEEIDWSKP